MNKFGELKSKMLTKLTESYTKENKTEVKDILKTIKENKDFKEMYLFYEEIENKYIEDKETAKLYVEGISSMLSQSSNNLTNFCQTLNEKLGNVETTKNELYESLDQLTVKDSLSNIENKVMAKKKLVNHLTTKKEVTELKQTAYSQNENLLHAVLANNFNVLYSNTLSESQQEELKNILSIPTEELESKTIELKESITEKVNSLLNEAVADNEMSSKLNKVKNEVDEMKTSRYNYYRLTELKNGLN
jgi:hypothetical protein